MPDRDGLILVAVDNDDQPVLNRVEVSILEEASGAVVASHALDLNQRLGFDATTTAALDSRDTSRPYFDPLPFEDAQKDYQTRLVIPAGFAAPLFTGDRRLRVVARDIWGRAVQLPAPVLSARHVGAGIQLRWPAATGLPSLEAAASLLPPVAWRPLTNAPALLNGWHELSLQPSASPQFFRLAE